MTSPHALAESWWMLAGRGLAEGSLALSFLLLLWWPLRRRLPPRVACVLFLFPLLKVALPVALPVPSWLSPLTLTGLAAAAPAPAPVLVAITLADLAETAALPPAATPPAGLGARELLCALWLLGVLVLTALFVRAQVRTGRAVRAALPVDPATLPLDLNALRARAGVFRRVRWLVSDRVATPAAGGLLRPYVLLPHGFAATLPARQLAFVLLHELAHIRRCDVAVALGQRVLQILWFFHPAVWLASWLIDQHRELACDQDALARSGASRRECGEAFLSVAAWVHGRASEPTATLAMFESRRVLRRRLMQILTDVPAHSRLLTAAYLALAAAIALPSAKAADASAFDLAVAQQDDGERAEIEKLRRQIAELKKQHAELLKQLAKSEHGEAKEKDKVTAEPKLWRKAKAEAEDDDGETGAIVLKVEGDGKPIVQRITGKGVKGFAIEDGKVRELKLGDPVEGHELKLGDSDDGAMKVWVEGGDGTHVWHSGKALKLEGGDVKVLRNRTDGQYELKTLELPKEVRGRQIKAKMPKVLQLGEGEVKVIKPEEGDLPGAFRVELKSDGKEPNRKVKVRHRADDDDDDDDDGDTHVKSSRGKDGSVYEVRVETPRSELKPVTRRKIVDV